MNLNEYLAALKVASANDDKVFHSLLLEGIRLLNLTNKEIAHRFDVSRPTIERWRTGINAPHPAMRKAVYDWLLSRIET